VLLLDDSDDVVDKALYLGFVADNDSDANSLIAL